MKRYNIRVYALIFHEGKILLTDEIRGRRMTKFPGGGLEWGEGIADCVRRECVEELGQEPVALEHFYTTDFFIASAFNSDDQLISIYYTIELPHPEKVPVAGNAFDFGKHEEGEQIFRWVDPATTTDDDFTFPIDRLVAKMLRERK